ncbi:hypothetical protein TNCV_4852941 [Trichonephila clavipes]|nr:hypothetical protein TNCV_4852941 [Trichonephila clavipes]
MHAILSGTARCLRGSMLKASFVSWMPPNDTTLNAATYSAPLHEQIRNIKDRRPGKLPRGVFILHDNFCPHIAVACQTLLRHFRWEFFENPLYSQDLSPYSNNIFGTLYKAVQ